MQLLRHSRNNSGKEGMVLAKNDLKGLSSEMGLAESSMNRQDSLKVRGVQSLVSCGGGRRPADGLRQQHVRTIRLLVWDTLEDFRLQDFIRGTKTARYTHVHGRRTN
jgi:hypothetical protein